MCCVTMRKVLCVVAAVCGAVGAFNVDIDSRVVHQGALGSMFGFAVQAHADGAHKMVLVGAPEDEARRVPAVERPGAVFRCDPAPRGRCQIMLFDRNGTNNVDTKRHQVDKKSHQWFGATLSSTGHNGPIVACAPRYVSYGSARWDQRDPVGTCFVAASAAAADAREISPCRTSTYGERKTGICQAGFAAAVSKDGQRLFMGAPGSFYWQGQLYSQNLDRSSKLISTIEGGEENDDSYMGYSVAVGDFAGAAQQGVAVGVPRGADLRGVVVLYTWELQNIKNITGSQIGAYFGYSLAAGDVDGDGRDDVIVGAPMYSRARSDGFEHGRVYVIYQGLDQSFSKSHARTGDVSKGRFGLSVAYLGDINLDGFGDVAVGAPYGGVAGRGAVHIYHGSERGLRDEPAQVITAEQAATSRYLSTFGWSLSGGVDLDNNNYTDLVVGAYKADSVVVFRSRPVVKVMADIRFTGKSKQISLSERGCRLPGGAEAACAQLMFCLTYTGINVDQQIEFRVDLDLDARHQTNKRLFLESRETSYSTRLLLLQGKHACKELTVYLDDDIRDKLTPLEVAMTYSLSPPAAGAGLPPVLDAAAGTARTDALHILKHCGADNVCVPDLKMTATTATPSYVVGSGEDLAVDVRVENAGEDAYEAAFYLTLPPGVTYAKMERLDAAEAEQTPMYCSVQAAAAGGDASLKCELGNPLESGKMLRFRVGLQVEAGAARLEIPLEANSTNPEPDTRWDNVQRLLVDVVVRAQLAVLGTSDPPELHYNASLYGAGADELRVGPQVVHKYNVKNEGPHAVEEAEIYLMWPYQTLAGDNLMYLLVQPTSLGNVRCEFARRVNPDQLFIHNPYYSALENERRVMNSNGLYQEDVVVSQFGSDFSQSRQEAQSRASSSQFHRSQAASRAGQGASQANQAGSFHRTQVSSQSEAAARDENAIYNDYESHRAFSAEEEAAIRRRVAAAAAAGGRSEVVRRYNKTVTYDEQGSVVDEVESSTQYGTLGREGEAGSSFSNRFGSSQAAGQEQAQGRWSHSYVEGQGQGQGQAQGQGLTWSTEETVNRDLASYGRGGSVSVVADDDDEIGGVGAYAARSPNNQFKYGVADIGTLGADQGSQASRSASGYGAQGSAGAGYSEESASGYGQAGQSSHGASVYERQGSAAAGYSEESASGYGQAGQSSHAAGGYGTQGSGRAGYARGYSEGREGYEARAGSGYSYSSSSASSRSSASGYSASSESHARRRRAADPALRSLLRRCEDKYRCEAVRCVTGRLAAGQELWLALRARLNATVLNEISQERPVRLSTMATARAVRLAAGAPAEPAWSSAEAPTLVTPQLEARASGAVPLWVVVLAAVLGALLLLLLILALYKCGFFKRNRPSDHAERQPLNGRDEHL